MYHNNNNDVNNQRCVDESLLILRKRKAQKCLFSILFKGIKQVNIVIKSGNVMIIFIQIKLSKCKLNCKVILQETINSLFLKYTANTFSLGLDFLL